MILEIDYIPNGDRMESPCLNTIYDWPSYQNDHIKDFIWRNRTIITEGYTYVDNLDLVCVARIYIDYISKNNYKRQRKCLVDTNLLQEMKQTKFPENHPFGPKGRSSTKICFNLSRIVSEIINYLKF